MGRPPEPPTLEGEAVLPALLEESLEARAEKERRSRPLRPGETLDPNRSGEEALDRLPGVGPSLARAIIADREKNGGFRSPEDLLRVKGVGPSTLEKLRPLLDFSEGMPLELGRPPPPRPVGGVTSSRDTASRVTGPLTRIDLNRASAEELQTLPGIGPALAERILESRRAEGPFSTAEDLLRVRGIGPVTLERIRTLVRAGK